MPEYQIDLNHLSVRNRCLATLLLETGYPTKALSDAVVFIEDERDLFDLLRFLVRHWQPKAE